MKRILLTVALGLATTAGAFAQGELVFANFAGGASPVNARVTEQATGQPVNSGASANGWFADLFYGPAGAAVSSLTDAGFAVAFKTGTGGSGYFLGGATTLPTTGNTELQVRVWQLAAGSSWAAATGGGIGTAATYTQHGGTEWGYSTPITLNLPTSPTPSPTMSGLAAFQALSVAPIPEPTTLALGGLGAAALFLIRRRK